MLPVRLLFCCTLSKEVSDTARRVVGPELDAPASSLAKATDQHAHELECGTRVLRNERSKLLGGQRLHCQRIDCYRGRGQSTPRVQRSELADYIARTPKAKE
jgi:hypothetical protein